MQRISVSQVLVVDDEENIRNLLSAFFSLHGYEAISAGNGKEALDILKNTSCDLLMTDLDMPKMNGLELVDTIRKRNIPLIIIGMSFQGKKTEFLRAGADYFLCKPFNFQYLKFVLNSIQGW
jgi:DNA-binding response OmpR family regulator